MDGKAGLTRKNERHKREEEGRNPNDENGRDGMQDRRLASDRLDEVEAVVLDDIICQSDVRADAPSIQLSSLRSAINTTGTPKHITASTKLSRRVCMTLPFLRNPSRLDASLRRWAIQSSAAGTAVHEPTMIFVAAVWKARQSGIQDFKTTKHAPGEQTHQCRNTP